MGNHVIKKKEKRQYLLIKHKNALPEEERKIRVLDPYR